MESPVVIATAGLLRFQVLTQKRQKTLSISSLNKTTYRKSYFSQMDHAKNLAIALLGVGLILFFFVAPGMQLAVMAGGIIGCFYCMHKAFERRGFSKSMNAHTRFGWFTKGLGVGFCLFLLLNWPWLNWIALVFGVCLTLLAIWSVLAKA